MFDITNIAVLSGSTEENVRTLLPSVLDSIRKYTNRSYITSISVFDILTIDSELKMIYSLSITFEGFVVGDIIEIKNSANNTKLYTVKSIAVDKLSIEVYEPLISEEIEGYVIKLSFDIYDDVIANFIRYKNTSLTQVLGISAETLDGYSYTKEVSSSGYPKSILSTLSYLRKLPGSMEKEYNLAGYYIRQI